MASQNKLPIYMQDGTSLISVVSHLKDNIMQIFSDLGVSVPTSPTVLEVSDVESQVAIVSHVVAVAKM